MSGQDDDAVEPYTLWGGEGVELRSASQFLVVTSPLDLPWDDKALAGGVASQIERLVFEDEKVRRDAENAFSLLQSHLSQVALALDSDYVFGIDWELKRYLRTYGFGVELFDDEPLIDKLIKFILLAKDASLKKVLLFVNLKSFLTESELDRFFEQAFFAHLSALLIENAHADRLHEHERKYVIDQDLLESW